MTTYTIAVTGHSVARIDAPTRMQAVYDWATMAGVDHDNVGIRSEKSPTFVVMIDGRRVRGTIAVAGGAQ